MTALRLSPSGPVVSNSSGGPFDPGSGARLRLTETVSTMTGSLAVPAVADVISPDGFGDVDAIVLTLDNPRADLGYRASLSLDIVNTSSNIAAEVVLYLDVSVDGGATYTNRAKVMHPIDGLNDVGGASPEARNMDAYLILKSGAFLGVVDGTASIKVRARASKPVGTTAAVLVSSAATSGGGTPVTGLDGTIHMTLEECF